MASTLQPYKSFVKTRESAWAALGLLAWLRLGGALSSSYFLSQVAFGAAAAWQLYFCERAMKPSPSPKRLTRKQAARYGCAWGLPVWAVYMGLSYGLVRWALTSPPPATTFPLWTWLHAYLVGLFARPQMALHSNLTLLLALIALVAAASIEELFWRGYVQPIWCAECERRGLSPYLGIVLGALFFGLAHVASALRFSRILTAVPGLWFGYAARRTGGTFAPTLLHVGCNLCVHILSWLVV